jgi:predicted Ser/Thr protein kinase
MPLSAGTRLGPYEILAQLGAGGMGEVYRGRDTRLDRSVAVKVSAAQFSERFEREARAISALNHPHICTLYDVGPDYLVMELVEGPTLAERIAQGPMPLAEALPIARQVVEALEAAHEKGIVHRDLKPSNIKLTAEDSVKVLDFGLAKMVEAATPAPASNDPSLSPTVALGVTRAGMILGTAAYMAPEQARGIQVDKRADVWAFGCVLFEMLTGRKVFPGESVADVMAAVVRADPEWSALPASTPAAIRRLLERCLEKDRKRRLPDIGVARLEIDDALAGRDTAPAVASTPPPARRSSLAWTAAAAALLVLAGVLWLRLRPAEPPVWSGVMLGGPARAFMPRLSPDGQLLAFLTFVDELPQLGVMKPDGGSFTMLTRDRDAGYVATAAWARDGSRLYYDRYWGHPRGVYSVPPLGGDSRLIVEDAFGPEPLPDGSLLVAKLTAQGDHQLFHYRPDSGRLDPLPAFLSRRDVSPIVRAFPDGKEIVFYGAAGAERRTQSPQMHILDLATGRARELYAHIGFESGSSWCPLAVSPDGQSVITLQKAEDTRLLTAFPRTPGGRPRVLLSFQLTAAPNSFDVARDGSLYLNDLPTQSAGIRFPVTGGVPEDIVPVASVHDIGMGLLPDGRFLYTMVSGGKQRLAAVKPGLLPRTLVETAEETSLPAAAVGDGTLAFVIGSGDARRLALASLRDGRVIRRFNSGSADVVSLFPAADGREIYYAAAGAIWSQPVAGGNPRHITDGTDAALDTASGSLYVKRTTSGTIELYRIPAAGGEGEKIAVPAEYQLAQPSLAPTAIDRQGRVLVTVISALVLLPDRRLRFRAKIADRGADPLRRRRVWSRVDAGRPDRRLRLALCKHLVVLPADAGGGKVRFLLFPVAGNNKADSTTAPDGWLQQLPDGIEYRAELRIVLFLQRRDLFGEVLVLVGQTAQLDKCAHDGDVDLDGAVAVQYRRQHSDALLREDVRQIAASAAAFV